MRAREEIDRLLLDYDSGRLVPFLGAGMSQPACPDWRSFVAELERHAADSSGLARQAERNLSDQFLAERAERAIQVLRRSGQDALGTAIAKALASGAPAGTPLVIPRQTDAIARIPWPLVLSTNYDDFFLAAVARESPDAAPRVSRYRVLGRSIEHCQRVLSSLREPADPILWAIHGYVGGLAAPAGLQPRLDDRELIVGHAEYRRVMHTEPHFRRAFSEVFRTRSLLFVGCSLSDEHLLGLLEEVLALTGPSPMAHHAVLFREDHSEDLGWSLRTRFNIVPLWLDARAQLVQFLEEFRVQVPAVRRRSTRWTVSFETMAPAAHAAPDLEVVRGGLPERLPDDRTACVVVSAGVDPGSVLAFSSPTRNVLVHMLGGRDWPDTQARFVPPAAPDVLVQPLGHPRVIAAVARDRTAREDTRDARRIGDAMLAVLEHAARSGFGLVHCQLLAASRSSPYPARSALAHMLRGFAAWRRKDPALATRHGLRLRIHVLDEPLLLELASGRLDVPGMVDCERVRFWLEFQDSYGRLERELREAPLGALLGDLAGRAFEQDARWFVTVEPPSREDEKPLPVRIALDVDLQSLGVIHGSTVRIARARGT